MKTDQTNSINIGCAAWGWRDVEVPDYFRWSHDHGISLVEVNAHPGAPKHLLHEGKEGARQRIKAWAQAAEVQILCVAARNNFTLTEGAALEAEIQRVRQFVDDAEYLAAGLPVITFEGIGEYFGASFVRLLSGSHRIDSVPDEVFTRLHYAFNQIGDYAHDRGVQITIENHGGPTATGQRVARIMAGVRSPAVGVNYDPANFLNQGTDPLMALRYILPWVNYSHWKDVRWVDGQPQFCAFGEGEIVWSPIIETLLDSGYQGHWLVEYEEPSDVQRGTQTSLENLAALLTKVGSR